MTAIWSRGCTCFLGVAMLLPLAAWSAPAAQSGRTWEFDLEAPRIYKVQVLHDFKGILAGSTKATYTITLGDQTESQEHELILNRPFVPLELDIRSSEHFKVQISGISDAALQRTHVTVSDGKGNVACSNCRPKAPPAGDLIPADIRRLLALPEGEIDIGIAALTFAKEIYPDIDIPAYSKRIDALADKVRRLAQNTQDPERRIRILNTVLFRDERFHYDREPFARANQKYYFLNGILDTKQGICYTMPLLYIAVAQRLGYPIYPVAAPDHLFVRYAEPSFKEQNIEVTSGGKYFPDGIYIRDFAINPVGLRSGSYLRTMTYREFLGHLLAANALVFAKQGQASKALLYSEKAVEFNPKFADHYDALRIGYSAMSNATKGDLAEKARQKAGSYAAKAQALGYVDPATIAISREKIRGTT